MNRYACTPCYEHCVKGALRWARKVQVNSSHYLIVGVIGAIQEEGHINRGCVCQLVQSHELHRARHWKPDMAEGTVQKQRWE